MHTVRGSTTMTNVMLTRAGVGEGRSSQTKGNAGGSTSAWHLEPERRQGPGARRSVVGGPARPCHLLARSSAPRRSSIRGRASRMERLPIRQLGTPAGARQGSLNLGDPTDGNEPAPALGTHQRHPQGDPMVSSLSGGPRNSGRVRVQFRPLTREGDVQGDVGRSCCVRMCIPDCIACRARSAAGTAS